MKIPVKNIMPTPADHIVLSPKQERGKTVWLNRDHVGYEHRLVEFDDGTIALYLVKPNGRIVLDERSVVVREVDCPNCGEHMNPATNKDSGTPDPNVYGCEACGHTLICGEKVDCA